MAITLTTNPSSPINAYSDALVVAQTNDDMVTLIKYELVVGGQPVIKQYSPVYQGTADFHLSPVYKAVLSYYNNPLTDDGNTFYLSPVNEMTTEIIENYTEVITPETEEYGTTLTQPKQIIKRVYNISGNGFSNRQTFDGRIVRHALEGQKIPITLNITDGLTKTVVAKDMLGNTIETFGSFVETGNISMGMKKLPTGHGFIRLDISGETTPDMELLIDNKCYPRKKTIYFINSYGGWEWFNAIDYEVIERTQRDHLERFTNGARNRETLEIVNGKIKEEVLYGPSVTWEYINHLEDMISSSLIFDEQGNKIRIIDNNFDLVRDGLMDPQLRIEYLKENTINY